jgi:hypothetical protein
LRYEREREIAASLDRLVQEDMTRGAAAPGWLAGGMAVHHRVADLLVPAQWPAEGRFTARRPVLPGHRITFPDTRLASDSRWPGREHHPVVRQDRDPYQPDPLPLAGQFEPGQISFSFTTLMIGLTLITVSRVMSFGVKMRGELDVTV